MNIKWLAEIAKEHPAIARTLEVAILMAGTTLLDMVSTGLSSWVWDINLWLVMASFVAPIWAGLQKYLRDLESNK